MPYNFLFINYFDISKTEWCLNEIQWRQKDENCFLRKSFNFNEFTRLQKCS